MKSHSDSTRIVVTDTGPLIALAKSGCLHLLRGLFKEVIVPASVLAELRLDENRPGSAELAAVISKRAGFMVVKAKAVIPELALVLDAGEAEAISLAEERGYILLIDERKGRSVARARNVPIIGTGRLLVAAKKHGYLDSVGDALVKLRQCGYRLSDPLCAELRRLAGE